MAKSKRLPRVQPVIRPTAPEVCATLTLPANGMRLTPPKPSQVTRHTSFEDLPQFLTVDEFRTFVGIGRSTVYDLLRRGQVPHRRFGRVVRISQGALRSYLELAEDGREFGQD